MKIQTSTTKVYHGGGRRWFTKKAAERAEAWRILKEHCCDCEDGESDSFEGRGYPGNVCELHQLRDDYKQRAITTTLESALTSAFLDGLLDEQEYTENINDMVNALMGEQQVEMKQESDQTLTDILSL